MISIADDNEFSVLIADLIETLAGTNRFTLRVWVNGSELPFIFSSDDDFYFMQEGFRVSNKYRIDWFFYDNIVSMRVQYEVK